MFSRSATVLLSLSFLAGVAAHTAPARTGASAHESAVIPAALRPVLYQTLARDAGPAYVIGQDGCAALPRQHLRACFDSHGVRFIGTNQLALRLTGWGRGSTLHSIPATAPAIAGNRVRYAHGALTEWWRVLPMGFEQGFTIARRPTGNSELTLALTSGGHPTVKDGAVTIGKLRYGKLVVTDAVGKVVPSHLATQAGRILIAVNDADARYPLSVDPLVWLEQKVTPSDGAASDNFGWSVALSSTTALVGAAFATVGGNADQGAVYVFTKSGGTWSQTQKLTASDGATDDYFGFSVALDGTTALVGVPFADVGGNEIQGTAYVFTESGGTWSQSAKLTTIGGTAHFGWSVALDGTTALVGAPLEDGSGGVHQGAAYVFTESGGTWSQSVKLTASDGTYDNYFGWSVAFDGTTALVGAYLATVNDNIYQGAAYVFTEAGGSWAQNQKLTASDGAVGDFFGNSVALDGSTALVGAPALDASDHDQGAAYVFTKAGGTWSQSQKLTASDGAPGDGAGFGYSVALSGTTALVGIGAPYSGVDTQSSQGRAYVFTESGGTWTQTQELAASDGAVGDFFGNSVALDGSTALVGAPWASVGSNDYQGAAYFEGASDLGLAESAPATVAQHQQYVSQTIATNNASAATAAAVVVTVAVPAAAGFVSASATQGSCAENAGVVSCNLGALPGNGGTATANVTLKATGNVGDVIDNTASVVHATPPLAASAPTTITLGLQAQAQPPIHADGSSVFRTGHRVIAVKFSLTSGGIPTCDLPPATISLQELSGSSPGVIATDVYQTHADNGANFRIDTSTCQYVYNISTRSLEAGTYQVQIIIDGYAVGNVTFNLD